MATVRRAALADAAAMAAVHVDCWEETYAGVLPRAYLAERTVAVRHAFWRDRLLENDPAVSIFVACAADGVVCGFASGGPERGDELGADGELYSLYVLRRAQGSGLGRALVRAVLETLERGTVAVWVLGENPARGFYEHLGGRWLAERRVRLAGEVFTEVAYDLGTGRGL